MASLRDTVKDYQDELRDGIAWVAFWKQGRSWNAEYFHLDMDDTLYPEDRSRLEEIKSTDPAAVILNGYYCGHLGEDMSLDELTAGVRYHYENSMNDIDGFIGAHDDRLPPEVIEEARAAAHEAGLPFSEKPYRDGEDFNPYVFDGSMSIEDFELMHRMIEKERSEQMAEPILSGYLSNLGKYTEGRPAGEWVTFPTTAEHLKEVFDRIGIDFKHYEEWHFTEFQSPIPGLAEHLSEYSHPDELNYLGKLLEMQFDDDREKFIAAIEYGDHADSLQDIINLAQNLDCYWIYPSVHNEEEYGRYLVDELEEPELPEEAKKYFMYEEYGRDASINDDGMFTEKGYIYNNRNTFTEWYDGRDVPQEYRVTPQPPQRSRPDPEKADFDAAAPGQRTAQTAEQPQEPRPVIPIVLTSEKPAEKLKEITDRLEQGIAELFDSERYKEYLKVMSKFHNYSFRNTVLIAMQKPDASLVAGFSAWKNNFERNVMKGQKGIKIIAPSPYKIKQEMQKIDPHTQKPIIGKDGKPVTEEKEVTIPAYKVVSVFDVSQTEGKELPDIAVDELTGDVDRYKDFFAALEKTSPVPIAFENIEGGSHGYYHLEDKRIAINEGMSELQTLKTAIHEIAHAKLHDIDLNAPKDEQQPHVDRRTREVEAESVAYTVCQHYGLDTSDYSFGYVAGWSSGRELSELKSSLETIRSAAAEIINSIDENLAELQKAQDKEQTAGQEQPTREEKAAPKEQPQPEAPAKADTAGKEKPEAAAPGKSGAQEKAGAAPKEAFTPETIYKMRRNPYGDSPENSHLLQAYVTQENGRAKMGDVLYTGTPEKCRELMGQLKSGGLTEGDVKQLYAKAQETAQTAGQDKDTFSIYQIKGGDETRDFRFEPYDRLQAAGNVVDRANYELVYSAPLAPETSLEDIYTRFNIDHPKDFKGHSLSVSDVVVLHQDGQDAAHFVDSVGFREVPEFLQEQKQLTPDDLETGETVKTPRGTFHVTAMSREQIEAAGYGFHHQSDDGKYLIMGNGTRAFAVAAEQAQRDNPLKTAEQTIEQNGNMIDGIINNTPTVDELEAKVKAGEQISLVDLANAVKADKERGKGAKPEKKPSIRAQLKADKAKTAPKKAAAKTKNHDMEV
ncbi:antirestriction protein ArdA [Faecalibacterium sp. Marseille-Q0746]|uniref:antirestriction protein ArdA n=2 Tax=Oscillospiraceae TaxID=216572 RepID=UPI001A9AA413|nr:antirestriction protein ArdA [Faecalibacterium sp. Marseille-Q0746]MBO1345266.1 antirestriction protein ArdA [Faecalibacterium sp. Marseille-Q0746]